MVRVILLDGEAAEVADLVARIVGPVLPPPAAAAPPHVHRWKYDSPNGPTSTGRCDCGATTVGANSQEALEELAPGARRPGRPRKVV